jgi:hypothetical protein
MCEPVPSRSGCADHAARLRALSAEPSTWPQASRSFLSRPDNGFALVSTRWAKRNLDLADLPPPAEHASWTGGISQVGLLLIPIPHTPSAWLTRCRSPAGPRWPKTKGAATQELRRGGLLATWCAHSRCSICPLQWGGVARSYSRGLPSIPTTRQHEQIFWFIGRVGAMNV